MGKVATLVSEKDHEDKGVTSTVVDSGNSQKADKPRTSKTSLNAAQSLEILATAIRQCQDAGINVSVSPLYDQGHHSAVVVLVDVRLVDGQFQIM